MGKRLLALCCVGLLAACNQDMVTQEKAMPTEASDVFADGKVEQAPPVGTVSREVLPARPELTPALVERGRERFGVWCAPCHGVAGDGDGIIPRHGFPHPPSYHIDRLRRAPAAYFVQVIGGGHGVMYSYADRVAPADRWAIAAWIEVLQASQGTPVAQLSPEQRERVEAGQ
ncbi:MAG: c-type cytochrome [Actinomycetota bacterium]